MSARKILFTLGMVIVAGVTLLGVRMYKEHGQPVQTPVTYMTAPAGFTGSASVLGVNHYALENSALGKPTETHTLSGSTHQVAVFQQSITATYDDTGTVYRITLGKGTQGEVDGVHIGDSLETVLQTLGEPSRIDKASDHKRYTWDNDWYTLSVSLQDTVNAVEMELKKAT